MTRSCDFVAGFVLGIWIGLAIFTFQARAHFKPGTVHNQEHAITYAWCGQMRPCAAGKDAIKVARYESSSWWYFTPHNPVGCAAARNGQYLGCFQMGSRERRTYGHAAGVWGQARAAFRYFVDSGRDWSPWECKPWGCGW